MTLQPITVYMDGITDTKGEAVEFKAWTNGETWNGWECPYFEKSEADRLVKAWRDMEQIDNSYFQGAWYNAVTDQFCFMCSEFEDHYYWDALTIDNTKLYPIGAGCWIWSQVGQ